MKDEAAPANQIMRVLKNAVNRCGTGLLPIARAGLGSEIDTQKFGLPGVWMRSH
jgi:hypothetical protein